MKYRTKRVTIILPSCLYLQVSHSGFKQLDLISKLAVVQPHNLNKTCDLKSGTLRLVATLTLLGESMHRTRSLTPPV
jgi:hypothetical protein